MKRYYIDNAYGVMVLVEEQNGEVVRERNYDMEDVCLATDVADLELRHSQTVDALTEAEKQVAELRAERDEAAEIAGALFCLHYTGPNAPEAAEHLATRWNAFLAKHTEDTQ